jgi:leader peptidase (prepilin peptidase)/N-methyltransferase
MNGQLIGDAVVRSLLAAGLLFAVRTTYLLARNVEGLGLGDVKLAGAAASWLSWPHFTLALLVAVVAALVVVGLRAVIAGERVRPSTAVPFGAFLAPAAWIAWIAQVASS